MGEIIYILATANGFVIETESNLHMLMCSQEEYNSDELMPVWQEFMNSSEPGDVLRLPEAVLIHLNAGSAYKTGLLKSERL